MLSSLRASTSLLSKSLQCPAIRAISWTSQAPEDLIDITFVSPKGERTAVKGRIGDTILEVARKYNYPLNGDCNGGGLPINQQRTCNWKESTFGEGPVCCNCHVVISNEFKNIIPAPKPEEQVQIDRIILEKHENSRLGCQITLTKELNGMNVLVPHCVPTKIC
ncbi:hypothetical protein WA158_004825 [Blastocystis sp. Blastoise]